MAKILVTGSTGFVGKRLIITLLNQGHTVYALCRVPETKLLRQEHHNLHYIFGDLRNSLKPKTFPRDLDAAYYLVHSMRHIVNDLIKDELQVASHFVSWLEGTGVQQIIYLGGIIHDKDNLSPHLRSRLLVEHQLKESGFPTTILRASIIIGAGSASFEIIRDLCEKCPVMIAPRWLHSPCQPIAIQDVLYYLTHILLNKLSYGGTFDIGGPNIFTFKALLLEYAQFRHLHRSIFIVPVLTPRLSSLWLVFVTAVRFSLCFYLVESMKHPSVVQLKGIDELLPHACLTFTQALEIAFQKIAQNAVVSTWQDAWALDEKGPHLTDYIEVPKEGCLHDKRCIIIADSQEASLNRLWRIGGKQGYYTCDWAWKIRGWIDQLCGGVGLNRGRTHPYDIQVGDSIDFWKVLKANKQDGVLILFARMRLPGEAWLAFKIDRNQLIQTATFRPKGVVGRLYWYALFPIHILIFRKMAHAIAGRS